MSSLGFDCDDVEEKPLLAPYRPEDLTVSSLLCPSAECRRKAGQNARKYFSERGISLHRLSQNVVARGYQLAQAADSADGHERVLHEGIARIKWLDAAGYIKRANEEARSLALNIRPGKSPLDDVAQINCEEVFRDAGAAMGEGAIEDVLRKCNQTLYARHRRGDVVCFLASLINESWVYRAGASVDIFRADEYWKAGYAAVNAVDGLLADHGRRVGRELHSLFAFYTSSGRLRIGLDARCPHYVDLERIRALAKELNDARAWIDTLGAEISWELYLGKISGSDEWLDRLWSEYYSLPDRSRFTWFSIAIRQIGVDLACRRFGEADKWALRFIKRLHQTPQTLFVSRLEALYNDSQRRLPAPLPLRTRFASRSAKLTSDIRFFGC